MHRTPNNAQNTQGNIAFINVHLNVHLPFIFIYIFSLTLLRKYSDKEKKEIKKEIKKKNNGERERKNTLLKHNSATYLQIYFIIGPLNYSAT